jgi:sigma-B regulation protein RsbU (phosphoserine phosphatase)
MPDLHRLKCSETWAGNTRTASAVEVPGLVAWVHSVPSGSGEAGGDVHYVSVCPSCIVSRIALADVSGHGHAVASVSTKLRELMQQHLTALEQTGLMRDLNQAVQLELDSAHYATMVAVGFHGRRGLLVVTNAGHPPPFWYRAKKDEWAWLERQQPTQSAAVSGTPLGLLPDIAYDRMIVKPTADDLVVLYSDGVSEAQNPDGEELGRDGLMALARQLDSSSPEAFGTQLAEAVRGFRGGTVPQDDETIIIMQTTPRPSTGSDSS